MAKKIPAKELRKISLGLPRKERKQFLQMQFDPKDLEERIELARGLMKRDLIIGIPWAVAYAASLWFFQFHYTTLILFSMGVVYFVYTFFTTGSYGLNRRRIKAYQQILAKIQ